MKKCFKIILLLVILGVCTACEGDVTRALRHAGYSLATPKKLVCDPLFESETGEVIRFLTGTKAITGEGVIYELSPGQKFSNEQNCRVADTGLRVAAIFDNSVFLATNGGIYTLEANNNVPAYTEITSADNNYGLYATLFYSGNGIKYSTVDSQNGIYYSLAPDGNVYGYTVYSENRDAYPQIVGTVIVYNRMDYGDIIDYQYAGNSPLTYVRTVDRVYHLTVTNEKECSTYADIQCNYIMTDDEVFEKYGEYILAYNGSTVYTTYRKMFTMSGNG